MPRKRIEDGPNELRIIRTRRSLSQMRAAELVGVSRPMWSSWECRARQMTIVQLNTIQDKLGLTDEEVDRIRKWWTTPKKKRRRKSVTATETIDEKKTKSAAA